MKSRIQAETGFLQGLVDHVRQVRNPGSLVKTFQLQNHPAIMECLSLHGCLRPKHVAAVLYHVDLLSTFQDTTKINKKMLQADSAVVLRDMSIANSAVEWAVAKHAQRHFQKLWTDKSADGMGPADDETPSLSGTTIFQYVNARLPPESRGYPPQEHILQPRPQTLAGLVRRCVTFFGRGLLFKSDILLYRARQPYLAPS